MKFKSFFITFFFLLIIFIDTLFIKSQRGIFYLILMAFWIFYSFKSKFENRISLLFSTLTLVLSFIFSIANNIDGAEKSAIWTYVFLTAYIFLSFIENNTQETISISSFITLVKDFFLIRGLISIITIFINSIINLVLVINNFIKPAYTIISYHFKNVVKKHISSLKDPNSRIIKKTGAILFLVFLLIITLIGLITFFIIFLVSVKFTTKNFIILNNKIKTARLIKLRNSLDPVIIKIEPGIVYQSSKIILFGKGFGSKVDNNYFRLMILMDKKLFTVNTDYFDDKKIIFTVPIDWNPQRLYYWIEKRIEWNNKIILTKSNVVSTELIPRINSYSPAFSPKDNEYFEQLKNLDKETLRLNGYE